MDRFLTVALKSASFCKVCSIKDTVLHYGERNMQHLPKIFFYLTFTLILFASPFIRADVIQLTPPTTLNIDGQNISEGIFTLHQFSGIDMALSETEFLSLANIGDDVIHSALIGSGVAFDLLSYPGSFPLTKFTYSFDATVPDLPAVTSNVISANEVFTISLPFLSSVSDFYEVIDHNGNATFHSTAATLDTEANGFLNIDLFGDQSIFATFGDTNRQLSTANFQDHGTVVVVPVPAPTSSILIIFGLLLSVMKAKKIRIGRMLS